MVILDGRNNVKMNCSMIKTKCYMQLNICQTRCSKNAQVVTWSKNQPPITCFSICKFYDSLKPKCKIIQLRKISYVKTKLAMAEHYQMASHLNYRVSDTLDNGMLLLSLKNVVHLCGIEQIHHLLVLVFGRYHFILACRKTHRIAIICENQ